LDLGGRKGYAKRQEKPGKEGGRETKMKKKPQKKKKKAQSVVLGGITQCNPYYAKTRTKRDGNHHI